MKTFKDIPVNNMISSAYIYNQTRINDFTQPAIACSKFTIETLKGVEYVRSKQ